MRIRTPFLACLESIASQDYIGQLRVYVVDDGSKNVAAVRAVHEVYADDPRFRFMLLQKNGGKRKAQIAAIRQSSGDLVLNVDSIRYSRLTLSLSCR